MRISKVTSEDKSNGTVKADFDSIDDLANHAFATRGSTASGEEYFSEEFQGASSLEEVRNLAKHGWQDDLPEVMEIVGTAVETVDREYELTSFKPFWDVSGCEVDIGRYLSNEPENMIDYMITPTVRNSRVVTVSGNVGYSSAISSEQIKHRGKIITALALALSRLGYGVELYADDTARGMANGTIRTLVKGAHDELDASKIMYAYAHPSMLRTLVLSWSDAREWTGESGTKEPPKELKGFGPSTPAPSPRDLPQGTLYLPEIRWYDNRPDPSEELTRLLKELGIIQ